MLGAGFIGRGFQRAEQEVEVAATLGLRQLAGRFRQFLLLLGVAAGSSCAAAASGTAASSAANRAGRALRSFGNLNAIAKV